MSNHKINEEQAFASHLQEKRTLIASKEHFETEEYRETQNASWNHSSVRTVEIKSTKKTQWTNAKKVEPYEITSNY